MLTATVCAVAAGARSFVAVAEWVADVPGDVAAALETQQRCPSESAMRRLLGKVDRDRFDAAIGAFVQRLCAGLASAGRRRVLAVDGKTLRGSRHVARHGEGDGGKVAGRNLLAVIDQHTRVVLGQTAVDGRTSERGLATLALALALPAATVDGAFPARAELLVIACSVLVVTLIGPGLTLPLLVWLLGLQADADAELAAEKELTLRARRAALALSAAREEVLTARREPGVDPEAADRVLHRLDLRTVLLD